jgi:hypothetical protein
LARAWAAAFALGEQGVAGEQELEDLVLEALELLGGGAGVGRDGDRGLAVGVEHGAVQLLVQAAQVLDLGVDAPGAVCLVRDNVRHFSDERASGCPLHC